MSSIPNLPDISDINASFTYGENLDFEPPALTETFTSSSRFGHSSDFADMFGTKAQQESYIAGLLWLGILVASFFAVWLLLIMIFCCLGSKRVGFLSGKPFQRTYYFVNNGQNVNANDSFTTEKFTTTPKASASNSGGGNRSDDEDCYIENESSFATPLGLSTPVKNIQADENQDRSDLPNKNQPQHKTRIGGGGKCCGIDQSIFIRVIFILSGLIYITFAILLVTQGVTNLQGTIDTMSASSQAVANITGSGSSLIVNDVMKVQSNADALRTTLQKDLNNSNFCPGAPIDVSSNASNIDVIREQAANVVSYLQQIDDYANSLNLESLAQTLDQNSKSANDIYKTTSNINLTDWQSLIVLIPCTIIPSFIIASAIMASFDISYPAYHTFMVWIVFPIFVILVVVGAALSATFIMITTANADFCFPHEYTTDPTSVVNMTGSRLDKSVFINAPDVSVLNIAQKAGYSPSSTEYRVLSFYVTQCSLANPFTELLQYIPELEQGLDTVNTLSGQFNDTNIETQLSLYCNRTFDGLGESLNQLVTIVTTLVRAVVDVIQLIKCDSIVPIYQQAAYDGTCDYNMQAMMWVFSASIICSFFGFLMIMFRSAYSETVYTYTHDSQYGRSSAFHDENDPPSPSDYRNSQLNNDAMTRAGHTTAYGDSVIHSVENYEKNYLNESSTAPNQR